MIGMEKSLGLDNCKNFPIFIKIKLLIMKLRPIRIKDIARKLNISSSTVSRALKDHPDIRPETKKAVKMLAEELHYEPDTVAQSLRSKKTNTIGVIIPNFLHYFFSAVISGIESIAIDSGYYVMVCQSNDSYSRERSIVKSFLSNRVDGLLVAVSYETKDFEHFEILKDRGIPLIFFDRDCECILGPKVMVTDKLGAFEAVEHLISGGCKRIAFIKGPENLSISHRRYQGYLEALEKHGLSFDDDLIVQTDFSLETTRKCTESLVNLAKPPDAIFVITDPDAVVVIQTLKSRGIKIPNEIAVVGYGDDRVAQIIEPSLTTIAQNPFEIGRIAANLFLDEANNDKEISMPQTLFLKTKLIARDSTRRIH